MQDALARGASLRGIVHYLLFDISDDSQGVVTLEALASTGAGQHPAVMAEVQQVLAWAWREFPHTHGPLDEGRDWDHDLQVSLEAGGWHAVTLTVTGSPRFAEAFMSMFGDRLSTHD